MQIGLLGSIGRFASADRRKRPRGEKVICRTVRGLEVGSVLTALADNEQSIDGDLLRKVTPEDQLLINRIDRFRDKAFQACQNLIVEKEFTAVLVDVEHLFDGQSLYFYFLGDVSDEVNQLTTQLAETYEAKVKFRQFSQTLAEGCGPDCGTGESGCGVGGCGSCSVRSACQNGNGKV